MVQMHIMVKACQSNELLHQILNKTNVTNNNIIRNAIVRFNKVFSLNIYYKIYVYKYEILYLFIYFLKKIIFLSDFAFWNIHTCVWYWFQLVLKIKCWYLCIRLFYFYLFWEYKSWIKIGSHLGKRNFQILNRISIFYCRYGFSRKRKIY